MKVKEPNADEVKLAARAARRSSPTCTSPRRPSSLARLLDAGVIGIAYETIRNPDGTFPVLAPMSEVAGRLATQIGVDAPPEEPGREGPARRRRAGRAARARHA